MVLYSLNFRQIVDIVGRAVCVPQLIVERMGDLLQEYKDELLIILPLGDCHVDYAFARYKAVTRSPHSC